MSTKNIAKLEKKRALLVKELAAVSLMLRGKFGTTYRKCGKPTCWCADEMGHPYHRITWSENGQSRTKAIPAGDIQWARHLTDNYRTFRRIRTDIRTLDQQLRRVLDQLENELVNKTRKLRPYL